MVVGIWAILSCGAQYIPLDGGVVPDLTIRHVVEQSGGHAVVCLKSTEHRVRELCPDALPIIVEDNMVINHEDPRKGKVVDLSYPQGGCYVIYTSGKSQPIHP